MKTRNLKSYLKGLYKSDSIGLMTIIIKTLLIHIYSPLKVQMALKSWTAITVKTDLAQA